MSSVMLDGWLLSNIFQQLSEHSERLQEDLKKACMGNLITGILLWDKIDWIKDSVVAFPPDRIIKDATTNRLFNLFNNIEVPNFNKFESVLPFPEYINGYEKSEYYDQDFIKLVGRAGIFLELCTKLGVNYFPHPARAEYITKQGLVEVTYQGVHKIIIDKVDSELKKYYDEVGKRIGRNLDCAYPVLYDYIRSQADADASAKTHLNIALDLRDDKDIVELRYKLNELDEQFNSKGNIEDINRAVIQIEELSKSIMNDYKKKIILGELKIGVMPIFGFSRKNKIINLTFLTDSFLTKLLVFGKKERLNANIRQEGKPKKYYEVIKKVKPTTLKKYDVFISHASEDKDSFVRPLHEALKSKNIVAFYDEVSIKWGESLRERIDDGLLNSKLAVVVLSYNFFNKWKQWTKNELDGIFALGTKILPIWHRINKSEAVKYSPMLAGRMALLTTEHTVDEIADMLSEELEKIGEIYEDE